MKKLMIAVAGLAMCIAANAATYSWAAQATAVLTDTYSPLSGTFYAFDKTAWAVADITSALTTTGASALDNSLASASVASAVLSPLEGVKDTASGISKDGSNNLNLYGILVDTDGKNFAVVDTAAAVPLNASIEAGSQASFDFGMVTISDSQWTAMAPEPTSGLLLLIGMGALALRRRRA